MDGFLDGASASWTDVREHLAQRRPVVLPFGAYEQHGPHLPLATDTAMATAVAQRVARRTGALLLPAVAYGETSGNAGFPGTVSLSFDTVRAITLDICAALVRHGASSLVIVNGDFGNRAPLAQAAREAGVRLGLPVLVVDYPDLPRIAAEICQTPPAGDGFYHADEVETSIMLAVAADSVRMERAVAEYPRFPPAFPAAFTGLEKISASGVFGDPRPATAEKGADLLERLAEAATTLVEAYLDQGGDGPSGTS
ncbi:creatininase family protein [Micromonospora sp. CPCC 205371]|nr:creatininase family protein [Micromonospora sp. CPCC 205371]